MTKSILLLTLASAILIACNSSDGKSPASPESQKNPFTGTFIRDSTDEAGTLHDTLEITPSGLALENTRSTPLYRIIHKTGTQYIRDGKELPMENKQAFWTGEYHADDSYLEIVETQERYTGNGKTITNGRFTYFRLTERKRR